MEEESKQVQRSEPGWCWAVCGLHHGSHGVCSTVSEGVGGQLLQIVTRVEA